MLEISNIERKYQTYLVLLPTPHVRRLSALEVDVRPEILDEWFGGSLGLLDSGVNLDLSVLVNLLEIGAVRTSDARNT